MVINGSFVCNSNTDFMYFFQKQDSLTPEKWGSDSMVTPEKNETSNIKTTPVSAGKFKQRLSY